MSSSLAKQLSALKLKEATQKRVDQYRQATVLYDRSEAAKIDIDHIHSLAVEGYQNLRQINPSLSSQESLIFDQKGIDRFKLTEAENNSLSTNLKRLIRELSKSLLNTNTLKVLEYLLRNYQVHQFEGEYLAEAFLAFHSTPQYMKLVQNVDLSLRTSRLHFLNANSLSGHPVSQEFLVRQLSVDASVLEGYGRYVAECLSDRAAANTVFFAAPGPRSAALRSPAVSFLLAMSELAFAKAPAKLQPRFRLVVLRLLKDLLGSEQEHEETFPAVVLGLSTLILNQQLQSSDFQALFLEISEKFTHDQTTQSKSSRSRESHRVTLAKLLILAFQHLPTLHFSPELAQLLETDLLEFLLTSNARIVQLTLKYFIYLTSLKAPQISACLRLMKSILQSDQSFAASDSHLQKFLLVCYQAAISRNSTECLNLLKDVFGQIFFNALAALFEAGNLSSEASSKIEEILDQSAVHRLIEGPHSSKMSLVSALGHHSKAVKQQALAALQSSKVAASESLTAHLLQLVEQSFDAELLLSALQLPLTELSAPQQKVLFRKFLSVADERVHKRLRSLADKLPLLTEMFAVLDVALGKSKALKPGAVSADVTISTIKLITELAGARTDLDLSLVGKALLASRQFGVFSECLKFMPATPGLAADLHRSFQTYLDVSLASLDIPELAAALKTLLQFTELSPDLPAYKPKDETLFMKMVLVLLFGDEYSIENSTLQVISRILSELKDVSLSDIVDEEKFMLVLMLKGFKNDQFKNGHFLKILQTVRFATKKGTDTPGLHIYKHLLKRLLAKKFEFESGAFFGFEEADLKSLHDYLSDPAKVVANKAFLKDFYTFCLNSVAYYPEIALFSKTLALVGSLPIELLAFLPDLLAKIDIVADFRQQVVRQMFDLYLKSTDARSQPFETCFVKLRALHDVPFSYLASKDKYKGYLELVEIYLESNFKLPGQISEVKLSSQQLVVLANNILNKQHEGLLIALCGVLSSDTTIESASVSELGSVYVSHKGLQNYILHSKNLKLDTISIVVKTLRILQDLLIANNPKVRVYSEKSQIKAKTSELVLGSLGTTKHLLQTAVQITDEGEQSKLIVLEDVLLPLELHAFLEEKSRDAVAKLVQSRGKCLLEEVSEEESLALFAFIKHTMEFIVSPHKETKQPTEKYLRSLLSSFSVGLDEFRDKLKAQTQAKKPKSALEAGALLSQTSITMLTRLHHEIDFFIQKIMKIVAEQSGSRKLRACSEVFFNWLILAEKHRNNSLLKLLANYYRRAEKKNQKDVNPLMDFEIHYYSNFIQSVTRDILGKENTDLVISLVIVLYMFKSEKSDLNFKQLSHFILVHLLNRQEDDPVVNCTHIVETLGKGVFNLKGLIPTNDKRAIKKPKAKIIRDLLRRSDPLQAESSSPFEKIRSSRFSLIFLGVLNLTIREKRFLRYIEGSVTLEATDMQHSPLVAKLEYLLLEMFRFEVEFEAQEQSYSANAIAKKPKLVTLFSKIKKLCARNIELVVKLIPQEVLPLALQSRLSEEKPDFHILLRLVNSVHTKLKALRPSKHFQEYYQQFLLKFVSLAGVFAQEQGAAHAIHKFVQAVFVSFGILFKRAKPMVSEFVDSHFAVLMEIMTNQQVFSVKMSCLANLAYFSENLNDYFVSVIDDYMNQFDRVLSAAIHSKGTRAVALLNSTKVTMVAKHKKAHQQESFRSFVTAEEVVQLWLQTFVNLLSNLQNMMEPYLNKQLVMLAIASEVLPDLASEIRDVAGHLVSKLEERLVLGPLTTVCEHISTRVLRTQECDLVHKIITDILAKVQRDEFVDFQDTLFALIRESNLGIYNRPQARFSELQ